MSSTEQITISHNHWRIPSRQRAFSGWLEGAPTDAERQQILEETDAARASWQPNSEAMALVNQLENFVGYRVKVQLWDASMWFHELEGPFPFDANCMGVEVRQEGDFLQAFLRVNAIVEIPNDIGYSPDPYFNKPEGCDYYLVSLADLYEIGKVAQVGGIST